MKRGASPNSVTYELNTASHSPYRSFILEQEKTCQLNGEIFQKSQKSLNYENLLSKYQKLKNDLEKIIQMTNKYQYSLHNQESDEQNIIINELKNQNDNLRNQLNDRIALNQKLYNENNAIFKELESKKIENQNLKDKIFRQEDLLRQLALEKDDLEKNIYNLNQIKEKQEKEILNFNEEKKKLCEKNDKQINLISSRSGENININNKINEEKMKYKNLILELRDKENIIIENKIKTEKLNEKIEGLKNEKNKLTNIMNRNNQDIENANNILINEKSEIDQLINKHNNMDKLINERDIQINNLQNENNILREKIIELNKDNNIINNSMGDYKKHLIFWVTQNKKLSNELKLLLGRDEEIKMILNRSTVLKEFRDENNRLITSSLENIKSPLEDNFYQNENTIYNYKNRVYSIDAKRNNNFKIYLDEYKNEDNLDENVNESSINININKFNENLNLNKAQNKSFIDNDNNEEG